MKILVSRGPNKFPLDGPMGLEGFVRRTLVPKSVSFTKVDEDTLLASGDLDELDVEQINVASAQHKQFHPVAVAYSETVPDRHIWAPQDPALMTGPAGE